MTHLIQQIQNLAGSLSEPDTDLRLTLYFIRETSWQAICEIDNQRMKVYLSEKGEPQRHTYTVDDL